VSIKFVEERRWL